MAWGVPCRGVWRASCGVIGRCVADQGGLRAGPRDLRPIIDWMPFVPPVLGLVALGALSQGHTVSRRAVTVGVPAAAFWASSRANAGPSIDEINANRAKIGLKPLNVIKADGAWADRA